MIKKIFGIKNLNIQVKNILWRPKRAMQRKKNILYIIVIYIIQLESDKTNKVGIKLQTEKCYSRVYYYKANNKYLMD